VYLPQKQLNAGVFASKFFLKVYEAPNADDSSSKFCVIKANLPSEAGVLARKFLIHRIHMNKRPLLMIY